MSIRMKILAGFLLVTALTAGQGLFSIRSINESQSILVRMYDEPFQAINHARSAQTHFAEAVRLLVQAISLSQNFGTDRDIAPIDVAYTAFGEALSVVEERMPDAEGMALLREIRTEAAAWKAQGDAALVGGPDAGKAGGIVSLTPVSAIEAWGLEICEKLDLLSEMAALAGFQFRMDSEEVVSDTETRTTVIAAVVAAIGVLMAVLLARNIVGPIRFVAETADRIAAGNLDTDVASARRDEAGVLMRALSSMQRSLRDQKEAERLHAEEKERQRELQARRAQEIEELSGHFEEQARQLVKDVASGSKQMRSAAEAMAGIASRTTTKTTHVASASEQASANVQTVATSAEEMSASLREVSRQVNSAAQLTRDSVRVAEQTESAVSGLASASERIGEIVELISKIAAQTNLLALNATIEASRAGEAGRGFAVVASEVKALAAQTATATEGITAQAASIQTESVDAVKAIQDIRGMIGRINSVTATIASAVEQQTVATSEIAQNVQEVAQGAEEVKGVIQDVRNGAGETGDAAQTVLSSANDLSTQSENMRSTVNEFLERICAA